MAWGSYWLIEVSDGLTLIGDKMNKYLNNSVVRIIAAFTLVAVCLYADNAAADTVKFEWTPGAPGAGGAHTFAGASPLDDRLMFSANDMWGIYRSIDGGRNWGIVDVPGGAATFHGLAFHPIRENRVFMGVSTGFFVSDDKGVTWKKVVVPDHLKAWPGPSLIVFDPEDLESGIALVNIDGVYQILKTNDGGDEWFYVEDLALRSEKVFDLIYERGESGKVVLGCVEGVYAGLDVGGGWHKRMNGAPESFSKLVSFSGGYSDGRTILYMALGTRTVANRLEPGVYVSDDAGENWRPVSTRGLHTEPVKSGTGLQYAYLASPREIGTTCYVSTSNPGGDPTIEDGFTTVYKTKDGGQSWRPVLFQHPAMKKHNTSNRSWLTGLWGWSEPQIALSVSATNPDIIMYCNWVNLIISRNGGRSWFYSDGVLDRDGAIACDPMMVLTVNLYHISPHDRKRHHMSTADFCGWYSRNAGKSWHRSDEGIPQPHNIYDIAFDPDVPGRLWAASSRKHDIPQWNFIGRDDVLTQEYFGSISLSEDGGETWRQVDESGLPPLTTLSLYVDPESPVESRHIWAAVLGKGFYLSKDSGKTWESRSDGVNDEGFVKALRIKRGPDGKMYGLTSVGGCNFSTGYIYSGGLYVSEDEGVTWKLISDKKQMHYPCDFTFNPHDPNEIYLACMTPPVEGYVGGVWRTRDGGETWEQIFAGSCFSATIDPLNPDCIYICTSGEALTKGVHVSLDRGETWDVLKSPSKRPRHLLFDPYDPNQIYVSSWGGGLWRGKRLDN